MVRVGLRERLLHNEPFPGCAEPGIGEQLAHGARPDQVVEEAGIAEVQLRTLDLAFLEVLMPRTKMTDQEKMFH